MDSGLWKKLQRMAAAGDRVVVIEDGEAFVLIPLAEYERIRSGEASLVRISEPRENVSTAPMRPSDTRSLDIGPAGLWQAPERPQAEVESFIVADEELSLASDEAEGEERFYLEPVE